MSTKDTAKPPGTFSVTSAKQCFEMSKNGSNIISELESTQVEVDTRMMLHAMHARENGFDNVIIKSPVIITGKKDRTRFTD